MAIQENDFAIMGFESGIVRFWFRYNDATLKLTRAGADNQSLRDVRILIQDTIAPAEHEFIVLAGESPSINVGGLNYDVIEDIQPDDPDSGEPQSTIQLPDGIGFQSVTI